MQGSKTMLFPFFFQLFPAKLGQDRGKKKSITMELSPCLLYHK